MNSSASISFVDRSAGGANAFARYAEPTAASIGPGLPGR